MNRSRILSLLVLVLIGSVVYAWFAMPRQKRISPEELSLQERNRQPRTENFVEWPAALDFTGGEKLQFQEPKRDLFRPLYRAPVIKRRPPPKLRPAVIKLPPPKPIVTQPAVILPVGPKPIPKLTVLGYLQKDVDFTIFLASTQGDIYLVKQGDRFADNLLVRDVSKGAIVVSRGLDDVGLTLRFGNAKTQRMPTERLSSDRPGIPELNYFNPKPNPKPNPKSQAPGITPPAATGKGNIEQ